MDHHAPVQIRPSQPRAHPRARTPARRGVADQVQRRRGVGSSARERFEQTQDAFALDPVADAQQRRAPPLAQVARRRPGARRRRRGQAARRVAARRGTPARRSSSASESLATSRRRGAPVGQPVQPGLQRACAAVRSRCRRAAGAACRPAAGAAGAARTRARRTRRRCCPGRARRRRVRRTVPHHAGRVERCASGNGRSGNETNSSAAPCAAAPARPAADGRDSRRSAGPGRRALPARLGACASFTSPRRRSARGGLFGGGERYPLELARALARAGRLRADHVWQAAHASSASPAACACAPCAPLTLAGRPPRASVRAGAAGRLSRAAGPTSSTPIICAACRAGWRR